MRSLGHASPTPISCDPIPQIPGVGFPYLSVSKLSRCLHSRLNASSRPCPRSLHPTQAPSPANPGGFWRNLAAS